MRRIARFLRLPRSTSRIRSDIDAEIRFDIDMRAQDLMKEGLSPAAAHARAASEFGDVDATKRYCEDIDMQIEADERRSHFFEDLRGDLSIAFRGIRRAPAFAAVVLLTLALGIGANTAVFSVVRRVLIAPLPFRAPNELYRLYTAPSPTGDDDKLSAIELTELAAQSTSISGLTLFGNYMGMTYSDDHIAESWQAVSVAPNFFSVLGTQPAMGRSFNADDFVQGAPPVVMISYAVWMRLFGGDRGLIGRSVQLSGQTFTVVGVMPERFVGPTFSAEILRPLNVDGVLRNQSYARSRAWRAVARLKPNVSLEQWRSELTVLRPRLQAAHPDIRNAGVVLPTPLHEAIVGGAGPVLRVAMAGALLVLLATCVNIAGLFLSRAISRRRELGVRTALGAGRERLIRQVLAETLLHGIAGGAVGVALAFLLKALLLRIAGPMLPNLGDVTIDASVLAFAFAVSVASGVLFGIVPALAATRIDVRDALSDSGNRAASQTRASSRASRLLVATQVTFAMVLVVGAGLFVRTFRSLVETDLGYTTTSHQATFFLGLGARYRDQATQDAFVQSFMQRVHAIPGVTAVGHTVTVPWNGTWRSIRFQIDEHPTFGADRPVASLATASAEFFDAMGMTVRSGRGFNAGDRPGTAPVVVINESMARRFWPSSSPIGARIRLDDYGFKSSDSTASREIVGVVSDARADALSEAAPTVYLSAEQAMIGSGTFVVNVKPGSERTLISAIDESLRSLDAKVPLLRARTLDEVLGDLVRRQRVAMMLIGMFAALALLLAGLGVYGLVSYSVVARTREFGIRAALGASRGGIVRLVLRDAIAMTGAGVIAGLLLSVVLSRFVASMLTGVSATDPASYAIAAVVLASVVLAACAAPARATTRIEPVEALRVE